MFVATYGHGGEDSKAGSTRDLESGDVKDRDLGGNEQVFPLEVRFLIVVDDLGNILISSLIDEMVLRSLIPRPTSTSPRPLFDRHNYKSATGH